MSRIKQDETDNRPKPEYDTGAGYYVFYRLWRNWAGDSDFPFDRFNSLPDDWFFVEVAKFIETNDECKAKFVEALERDWEMMTLHEPAHPVRGFHETIDREDEIGSWPWPDVRRRAEMFRTAF